MYNNSVLYAFQPYYIIYISSNLLELHFNIDYTHSLQIYYFLYLF
jgi:hypothetical protein